MVENREGRNHRSREIASAVIAAIFCMVMGCFLAVIPWMTTWETNYFSFLSASSFRESTMAEWWRGIWISSQFRGAITGLGFVNIYIAFLEAFRLRRFAAKREDSLEG